MSPPDPSLRALQMACDIQRKLTPPGAFRPSCAGCPSNVECPLRKQCEVGQLRPHRAA